MYLSITVLVVSLGATPLIGDYAGYSIFVGLVLALPAYILTSKDTLNYLNENNSDSGATRVSARVVASFPALTFGIGSVIIGVGIIGWVLYNYLIERQPEFTGSIVFAGLGIGPALIYFGYSFIKNMFGKEHRHA